MKRFPGTPQQKLIGVNDKFGNMGIKDQQGTTRIIYDALPYQTGMKTYEFFKNCKTRLFPFTNLPENKLQVGESIVLQNYYLSIMWVKDTTTPSKMNVLKVQPLSAAAGTLGVYRSDFDFLIGENRVLKDISVTSSAAPFNVDAKFSNAFVGGSSTTGTDPILTVNTYGFIQHDVYSLKTDLIVPPGIEFQCNLKQGGGLTLDAPVEGYVPYLLMSFEGVGSILAPRTTF